MTIEYLPSLPFRARRGADLLLEIMASEGVDYLFGNPGTTELPLMDALVDASAIHYVLGLQEATVVAMADGYAQASGKPGVVNLHTAGGLGHAMGAIFNARVAEVPLVITAGQQDQRHIVTDPLLAGDLVSIARPGVKWAQEVTRSDQLPILVRRAFHDADAAPAGPVFLSLPMDVMDETTQVDVGRCSRRYPRPVASGLDILATELTAVPLGKLAIIAGDEIHTSHAADEVVSLAEALGAAVFGSSWPKRIPFPTEHPLWQGNLPHSMVQLAATLRPFDALLIVGGHSLVTLLYADGPLLSPHCKLLQLSGCASHLGRTHPTHLGLAGDIKASLIALLPLVHQALPLQHSLISTMLNTARERRRLDNFELEQQVTTQWHATTISPLVAAHEVVKAIGPDIAIIDEATATSRHVRRCLRSRSAQQYAFNRGGALGWGMPAAVGCSLGLGREPVVSLVGDGAALYSPQALWTAARETLPVTFIVMNNREYNVLKNFMRAQPHYLSAQTERYIAMDIKPEIDYQALAKGLGIPSRRVYAASEIGAAVTERIQSGKPSLIEIMISAE